MSTPTYGFDSVLTIVNGALMTGVESVKYAFDEDQWIKHVATDGTVTRARNPNRAGKVTITLAATSPSNDILSGFSEADRLLGTGIGAVFAKDNSGRTTVSGENGWVLRQPDGEFAKEVGTREWVIDCAELTVFTGGND